MDTLTQAGQATLTVKYRLHEITISRSNGFYAVHVPTIGSVEDPRWGTVLIGLKHPFDEAGLDTYREALAAGKRAVARSITAKQARTRTLN